jgi:hypothetical protein
MTLLPIVSRELRVAARRPATYWIRVGAALVGILLAGSLLAASARLPVFEVGRSAFFALAMVGFAVCLLAGVRHTADCVSAERREDTLGLLFLTDLRGIDVAVGKLIANSLPAAYALVGLLPVLALPLLLGGLAVEAVVRMAVLLLNTLWFSLSIGLAASTLCREARWAAGTTLAVLLGVTGGLPVAAVVVEETLSKSISNYAGPILLWPSPAFAFGLASTSLPGRTADPRLWFSIAITFCLGAAAFGFACWRLPRCWQERGRGKRATELDRGWNLWKFGNARERRQFRERGIERDPIQWLASRDRMRGACVWGLLFAGLACWLWAYWESPEMMRQRNMALWVLFLAHTALKLWIGGESAAFWNELRHSQALELLLSTPLAVRDILRGHWRALASQFLAPIATTVIVADGLMLWFVMESYFGPDTAVRYTFELGAPLAALLVLDAVAMAGAGMWYGLTSKNVQRACLIAAFWVLFLPWFLVSLQVVFDFLDSMGRYRSGVSRATMLLALGSGALADGLVLFYCRRRLLSRLRIIAASTQSPGWWSAFRGRQRTAGAQPQPSPDLGASHT